jgi:septal ring factor EnvC (AmiA/AmiB activator)
LSENANEVVRELLTELNIKIERMSSRVDQTYDRMERLESSLQKMETAMSSQERRVIILEQNVPQNLNADLALIKDSLANYKKFSWIVAGAVVASWVNEILGLLHK